MLSTIELKNYRGFQDYRIGSLSRVNLLVGMNNSGKTSVLEAIDLLASGGDPLVLMEIADRRGETVVTSELPERYPNARRDPSICHFFYKHDCGPGAEFLITSKNELGRIRIAVTTPGGSNDSHQETLDLGSEAASPLELRIESSASRQSLPLTDEGLLSRDILRRQASRYARFDATAAPPVKFITPDSLQPRMMAIAWDEVILRGREQEVIQAMRIIEPRLTNIFFLSGGGGQSGPASVLAALEGEKQRNPLGSYGDGMRRLLALSISLIGASQGFLLIDEVDTGLHYSVMGDMWRLIVETAVNSDVQVFATTHSLDCVRGLASLCSDYPQLCGYVALHKIEPRLDEAVTLTGDKVVTAVEHEIEVR